MEIAVVKQDSTLLSESSYVLGDPSFSSVSISSTGAALLSAQTSLGLDFHDGSLADPAHGTNAVALFAADGRYLRASRVGVPDGSLGWSLTLAGGGELVAAAPKFPEARSMFDGTLEEGTVLASVSADGHLAWQHQLAPPSNQPGAGTLVAAAEDSSLAVLYAADSNQTQATVARVSASGALRWQVPVDGTSTSTGVVQLAATPARTALLLTLGGTLYLGDTQLASSSAAPAPYAVAQLDELGAVRWRATLSATDRDVRFAATHSDAVVVIGSSGETELALFVRVLSAASAAQPGGAGSASP